MLLCPLGICLASTLYFPANINVLFPTTLQTPSDRLLGQIGWIGPKAKVKLVA